MATAIMAIWRGLTGRGEEVMENGYGPKSSFDEYPFLG